MSNRETHYLATGNDFDGAANDALFTSGGLFLFKGNAVSLRRRPRIRRLHFWTSGTVASWDWKFQDPETGTLAYDGQTVNFTVGATASGAGGATGVIYSDADGGASGTLSLKGVSGTFVNDEVLVDDGGTPGAAVVNGTFTKRLIKAVSTGTDTEYTEWFTTELTVPVDSSGVPFPLLFTTTTLSGPAICEIEWDYEDNLA